MAAPALTGADAAAARRAAAAILHQSQFHPSSVPRPLHGLLTAIGSALSSAGHAISEAVGSAGAVVPGGPAAVWVLLALIVLAIGVALARRAGRRIAIGQRAALAGSSSRPDAPEELERRADAAEHDGRYDDAVRLRFRAGLGRLAERDMLGAVASTPSGQLRRRLGSREFDALALRFDEIAYGAQRASADDARAAADGWRAVLGRGGSR